MIRCLDNNSYKYAVYVACWQSWILDSELTKTLKEEKRLFIKAAM